MGGRDGVERGVGRVASRRVEDVVVVVVVVLGDGWDLDTDGWGILISVRVYIIIVPLSHGIQVNVLSVVRAVSNCQRDSPIRGSKSCYTRILSQ